MQPLLVAIGVVLAAVLLRSRLWLLLPLLRLKLLKIGVLVEVTTRKTWARFATGLPYQQLSDHARQQLNEPGRPGTASPARKRPSCSQDCPDRPSNLAEALVREEG